MGSLFGMCEAVDIIAESAGVASEAAAESTAAESTAAEAGSDMVGKVPAQVYRDDPLYDDPAVRRMIGV